MSITLPWFLLALFILTGIQAQVDCTHPYSAQEVENCIQEAENPFPKPPAPDPTTSGNPPPQTSPTSKPPQQGNPPPQKPSPSNTPTGEPPAATHTSLEVNPSTRQFTTGSSEIRSQSDPSPSSATISGSAVLNTEYEIPTSISSSSTGATSAIPESGQANGNGTHVAVGLIVGIVVFILALIIVALILLYRRRRARRTPTTVEDTIERVSEPPTGTAAAAAAPLRYSSLSSAYSVLSSPTRYGTEKGPHSFISLPMRDGRETDLETYDPPSILHTLSIPADPVQHLELGNRIRRESNPRRVSEERLRSFIMDRYGAFPVTGHSPVESDDQLPPYPPSD